MLPVMPWYDELLPSARTILTKKARLFNLVGMGDTDRLEECLAMGADPNAADRRGRTALIRAVLGLIVEAGAVQVLLGGGADPALPDPDGLTALDHARRRLLKYE